MASLKGRNTKRSVSIIIPTYNRQELIAETIYSALNQTWDNFEVVLVDNDSNDDTVKIAETIARSNKRLRVFKNPVNLGPVANWRICLEKAQGIYVKILWSDDLISPNFLERTMPILEQNDDVAFVYSKAEIFSETSKKTVFRLGETTKYDGKMFLENSLLAYTSDLTFPVSPGCALFRKNDIIIRTKVPNGFGIDHSKTGAGIDLLVFLEALIDYPSFYYIDETMSFFRSHPNSITVKSDLFRSYATAKTFFIKNHNLYSFIPRFNAELIIKERCLNYKDILVKYYQTKEPRFLELDFAYMIKTILRKAKGKYLPKTLEIKG